MYELKEELEAINSLLSDKMQIDVEIPDPENGIGYFGITVRNKEKGTNNILQYCDNAHQVRDKIKEYSDLLNLIEMKEKPDVT